MDSELYESDFSGEIDYSETETESKTERQISSRKILVSTSEDITIEDESVILLDGSRNSKISLPHLSNNHSELTSKGKIYTGDSITIISKKEAFEHIIRCSNGNYINGNSAVYRLKGGNSVVFHAIGNSWYADR